MIAFTFITFLFITWKSDVSLYEKPHVSFSFDDGSTNDILNYTNAEWNNRIIEQLEKNGIKSVWFVAARGLDNEKGKRLLNNWDKAGNIIANHTYKHLNFNDSSMNCKAFIREIQRCDTLLSGYTNYQKIFRFPYLKTGNTTAKRDSLRSWLHQNGYKQGWVTIDNSDWYINSRLIQRLKQKPDVDISAYRDFYIHHIYDRALYYNKLSLEINHRQVKHTVLLHLNLTSALFLNDLIEKFKAEGWEIDNYSDAVLDPVYSELPTVMPSEQSLIWLLAKQKGGYDLRYPGEDGDYEKEKMDQIGL